jgi:predicted amidohydrolase
MSSVKVVSAVQYNPRFSKSRAEVNDNIKNCVPLLNKAYQNRSDLIVLPELCFSGYSFLNYEEAAQVSESVEGPTFEAMKRISQKLKCYIAWGYVEVDTAGKLYNSCSLVDPNGRLVESYRKMNLWGNDFLWATPGIDNPSVVNTELGLMSLVICRDLRDKNPTNIPRVASNSGLFCGKKVEVVAACTNWGKGGGFPSTTWMDFAADNKCTLVVSNRWGEECNGSMVQDFGQGGSCVIDPTWKVHTGGLVFGSNCVVSAAIE